MFGRKRQDEFSINDYDDDFIDDEEEYDADGYDSEGFDKEGFDKEGYNREGYHFSQYEDEDDNTDSTRNGKDADGDYDNDENFDDDDDYDYDNDDDAPKKKGWAGKIVGLIAIITFAALIYSFFFNGEEKPSSNEDRIASIEKVIGMMYQAKDVDELISRNETILGYFAGGAQSGVDIADSKIYMARYSDFKNLETTVDIKNVSESNGVIYATYTISNSVDPASERMGIFEFNDENKIDFFKEYRMYPIGE